MAAASNNAVIDIDSDGDNDVQPAAGNNYQQAAPVSTPDASIIPSEMAPIGEPNVAVDQNVLRDLHNNLLIENISLSANYPTVLDDNNLAGQSPIYCHCDSYNSEFHRNTNQRQCQKLI